MSDVSYALKEILHGQEIQPIVKSQELDRSVKGVESTYEDRPTLILKLKC